MSNHAANAYVTRLNVQYKPLEVIEEQQLSDACPYPWYNQTLCEVNGSVVRLGRGPGRVSLA